DSFVPILPERQSAVLAVSSIRRTPTCQGDGSLTTPYTATLAVAFDHRVLNGTTAARFLHTVREAIESFALDS
ncbi:2-oxo acid dehydrogenase subunit E2, partial [bacterium]|nr:2-oxo acid dehydrogenase subunit E2 [bacterium]